MIFLTEKKKFTWTFQLDNNLLENQKQCHEWMPQEISLAFTTKFPMLGLYIANQTTFKTHQL
jgi:hypothetical protein